MFLIKALSWAWPLPWAPMPALRPLTKALTSAFAFACRPDAGLNA